MRTGLRHILPFLLAAAFTGCGLVDEDLSVCVKDCTLDYELRLATNLAAELDSELSLPQDQPIWEALDGHFKEVFADYARDIDLSFYGAKPETEDSLRLYHETRMMNAPRASYPLRIRIRKYQHLAVANVAGNGIVRLDADDECHASRLVQPDADTLDCQQTGLFTARLPMEVVEAENQHFEAHLYMVNSATALVIDTVGSHVRDLQAYATGFAKEFRICDSTYYFRSYPKHDPVIRAQRVDVAESTNLCFATVNFPSHPSQEAKAEIGTDDPEGTANWQYHLYTLMPDGSVTRSVLSIFEPLKAGELKIIRAKVLDNGAVQPDDPTVGASIELEWGGGLDIDVDL